MDLLPRDSTHRSSYPLSEFFSRSSDVSLFSSVLLRGKSLHFLIFLYLPLTFSAPQMRLALYHFLFPPRIPVRITFFLFFFVLLFLRLVPYHSPFFFLRARVGCSRASRPFSTIVALGRPFCYCSRSVRLKTLQV